MKDIALPCIIVSAVAMMILPLPLELLDGLLVFNLALSLLLLIAAVFLRAPERFTALPSILLFTTLFRLTLNISTTRQLLGGGQAPEVVEAFGRFVVGGSVAVGVVIFLIVTVVQFLVIAKGAERVAEVSARFALDAMPGRQMAIDADVRSGLLSLAEARNKRCELQRECRLYGALDGAMKFVKGDAIAGILITVINILAGFCLGVGVHNLTVLEALHRYTLFTIGDGLVSQLPALLVAVAAGVTVTRVNGEEGLLLSAEIIQQLTEEPRVLQVGGVLIGALALVPGFPPLPLLALSLSLLWCSRRRTKPRPPEEEEERFRPYTAPALLLSCSVSLAQRLQEEGTLREVIERLRRDVFLRWGVIVPEPSFQVEGAVTGARCAVYSHGALLEHLAFEGIDGRTSERFAHSVQGVVVRNLSHLVDDTHTRALFELYENTCADLVNALGNTPQEVTGATWVMKQLIEEGVPIREARTLLQELAECRAEGCQGREELLARARRALRRTIASNLSEECEYWRISPELEHLLDQIITTRTPLDPSFSYRIAQAVPSDTQPRVFLCSGRVRHLLWRILSPVHPHLFVVTPDELPSHHTFSFTGELLLGPTGAVTGDVTG